jgi:hypothetical protein
MALVGLAAYSSAAEWGRSNGGRMTRRSAQRRNYIRLDKHRIQSSLFEPRLDAPLGLTGDPFDLPAATTMENSVSDTSERSRDEANQLQWPFAPRTGRARRSNLARMFEG